MSDGKKQGKAEAPWDSSDPGGLYRALFEEAFDGMFITDPHGRCVAVNPSGAALTGYLRDEIPGMAVTDLIPLEDPTDDPFQLDELWQGRVIVKERHLRRKDGSLLPVKFTARTLADGNLLSVVRDITERKKTEAVSERRARELAALHALSLAVSASLSLEQASTAALRSMMEAVGPDIAIIFRREGERLILQDLLQAQQWLAAIPEHRVGECICGLAAQEGRPIYSHDIFSDSRCTWEECKKAGLKSFAALPLTSGEEIIGVIGLASETKRDFEAQAGFLETLAHQVSVALANARRELAERKAAEDALRQSEERLRLTFDTSPDSVNISRLEDGTFVNINDGFTRLTGFTREDVVGKTSLDVNIWEDPKLRQELVRGLREKGFYNNLEAKFRRKDGSLLDGQMSASVIQLQGVPHIISVTRDITERKRAEEDKEKLLAQLVQAQKMESVGRLAGGVAHDFNNMLGVILGHAELAMMHVNPSEPVHANLMGIRKAAQRSADLTRQLLAFARKQIVAPKVLDLNDTVANMLNMLRRLIGEDINLAWRPGAGLWPTKIDPVQIDQILANLCVNARDAIAGLGKVTIETANVAFDQVYCSDHPGLVPGEYVMLAVSDDGCGMDKEVQKHIFEPFFTTKGIGRGTGLGLATVYGIVKQNEGFISVCSESGKGTTFKMYLPRFGSESIATRAATPEGTMHGRGETVLLVEDEPAILDMGKVMLEQTGYRVLIAGTPNEALRQAEAHTGEIHLLVTDLIMPEMNGRDLAERIKAVIPGLKCLFMSGYTADVIAQHGVLDAHVCFVQKPFSLNDLASKVREALEQKQVIG